MHQTKLAAQVVEVQVETLPLQFPQVQHLGLWVPANGVRLTGLDAGQHANQPLFDVILLGDGTCDFFLGRARGGQIVKGASEPFSLCSGMFLYLVGDPLSKETEVFV